MSQPYLTQRQQIALKLEGTEGTDAVPADADVLAPAYDIKWTPSFKMYERPALQSSFSHFPQVAGERSAKISFALEIKGSGTAGTAPYFGKALQAAGFSETPVTSTSVTYSPDSSAVSSCTIEIREGDQSTVFKSKKIVGARGTVTFNATKGEILIANFEFTGRYVEPTDTTAFTTPALGTAPQAFLGAAFSLMSVNSLKIEKLSIDMKNDVQLRNDVNQATGNYSAVIVKRNPQATVDPEQEPAATMNFFNKLTANTEGTLSFVLGATPGNIATFTAPKAQIINVAEADRNGIRTENLTLQLNENTYAGEDELSIVFT